MEPTNATSTGGDYQPLFGNGNPSIGDNETQTSPATTGVKDQLDILMEENQQDCAGKTSAEHNTNDQTCSTMSPFSLFAPSIQQQWLDDHKFLRQEHAQKYGSLSRETLSLTIYASWRKRYNLHYDAEGRICKRPTDAELGRKTIPFDLLKDLLPILTTDAMTAIEKSRRNSLNDEFIPAEVKECAPTIFDLPPQRQKIVKQSLLNSVPYPGLLSPERWVRWVTKDDKEQAPTIDTSGLDTFIRIARALAALGIPTYVHDTVDRVESHTSGMEAAIWTDLGRDNIHDWTIKQGILKFNYGSLRKYLENPRTATIFFNMAFAEKLWSPIDFQLSTQKMIPTTAEETWRPIFQPNGPRTVLANSAQVVPIPGLSRMNIWSNKGIRHGKNDIRELLNRYFCERDGAQILCDFPNFFCVTCGGGKGRSRQQVRSSLILKATSYDPDHGYTQLSCLYKLKIVWRVSSEVEDNGLRHETRKDDFKLHESEEYQTLLRRAEDQEQLEEAEEGDDKDWTLETSPMDYCFVVIYCRVGSELNEEDSRTDWESDPGVKEMYPERSTAMEGKSDKQGGQGLPDRST